MRLLMYFFVCLVSLVFVSNGADHEILVEKEGAGYVKLGIDLSGVQLSNSGNVSLFKKTLEDDLKRSGWFTIAGRGAGSITAAGSCDEAGGRLTFSCEVKSVSTDRRYFSRTFRGNGTVARRLAHEAADEIVWQVKKVPGIASTRVAMVGSRGGRKDLYLCDSDGMNFLQVTRDGAVCIAPNWVPGGESLVYTSFLGGFPDVYMIDLRNNSREKVSGFPGLNTGADVSPDGRELSLTLSKDGNPELYIMTLRMKRLTKLTRTRGASEASPSWSPDGKQIVFVSDTTGSPQLYVLDRKTGAQRRITFQGRENVSPDWGPDGKIVYSSRIDGRYHICVIDPATRNVQQLTNEHADHEDPSWAPDGRHIVYSRAVGYKSDLYILDTLGDPSIRLTRQQGDWYSPAWSPK